MAIAPSSPRSLPFLLITISVLALTLAACDGFSTPREPTEDVADSNPRAGRGETEQAHAQWAQSCSALESALKPDASLATRLGTHLAVCLKQPIYSVEFATRRKGDTEGIEQILRLDRPIWN